MESPPASFPTLGNEVGDKNEGRGMQLMEGMCVYAPLGRATKRVKCDYSIQRRGLGFEKRLWVRKNRACMICGEEMQLVDRQTNTSPKNRKRRKDATMLSRCVYVTGIVTRKRERNKHNGRRVLGGGEGNLKMGYGCTYSP